MNAPRHTRPSLVTIGLVAALTAGSVAMAAEPVVAAKDFPRLKPLDPPQALASFQVKKGFHMELAAAEPLVENPIAMAFDEKGRLFVAEMHDPEKRSNSGTIRMLEDTYGDGRYDKSTVFAKDLPWPTAVICYNGGVFVGAAPDIIWLKDTDGDGVADERKVVFTGFSPGNTFPLAEGCVNNFKWGLDNRIYGATSNNGALVKAAGAGDGAPLALRGRDFSFDPRTLTMRAESGGGQWGMSFDERGRRFVCSNIHHIQTLMHEDRYSVRNPLHAMPKPLVDIAVDGPAAEVFRISQDEPWRVFRQRWRAEAQSAGAEGGRASGSFTSAAGITVYTGNAFPAGYVGNAFIADPANNIVHRKLIRDEGVELVAERPADEQKAEFIASKDGWFRPVNFANAPDGTLYVADIYREIIEGAPFIPEGLRKFLDFSGNNGRGRIYRLVPDGFQQPPPPRLAQATTAELVALLAHTNGWHRETAARLLFERQDKDAVSLLAGLLAKSQSAQGRLHALYALDGQSALSSVSVLRGLADTDALVREHAVRLSENLFHEKPLPGDELTQKLFSLANDPSARVRYQLAFTLGEVPGAARIQALAAILHRDRESSWTRAAVLSSLARDQGAMFALVSADAALAASGGGQEFLRQLAGLIGAGNQADEVAVVFNFLTASATPSPALVRALGEGLRKAGNALATVDKEHRLKGAFSRAFQIAADAHAAEPDRVESTELLSLTTFKESATLLGSLLGADQPQAVQLAALNTLARFTNAEVGTTLIRSWESFTPRLRSEAMGALLARPERSLALLNAIKSGTVKVSDLNVSQIQLLQKHWDKRVQELAAAVLSSQPARPRQEVVLTFKAALSLKGDAARGKVIYQQRCFLCHRADNQGFMVGPDFVTVKATGREKLLDSIIDPSREVDPKYLAYLVETKAGDTLVGVIASESATNLTLRMPFGKEETVLRGNVKRMQSLGLSLMPEGLEAGLTPPQMADLLEFIESVK